MNKYYMDGEETVPAEPVEAPVPEAEEAEEPAQTDGDFEPEVA